MRIAERQVREYLDYVFSEEPIETRSLLAERWATQVRSGERSLSNYFLGHGPGGEPVAALYVERIRDRAYSIKFPARITTDPKVSGEALSSLIDEALARLGELKARRIELRLTEKPWLLPLASRLRELGFKRKHTRIEFQSHVNDLPDENGSPMEWIPVSESGPYRLEDAAIILEEAARGDTDWNPEDRGGELLKSYLADREFASKPECIQIGQVDSKPAAIVIAQVIPATGWSRITYMGILPQYRGRGLGKWVHRRGFALMRAQGGTFYHGGTVKGNARMEALFRRHGCKEYRTMQEWQLLR